MSDQLKDELRNAPLPGADEAMERSRRVVLAAHPEPPRRGGRGLAPALAAAAVVLAVVTIALTPPGAAVADWLGDVVAPGREEAAPVLQALPAPGRLLVDAPGGPWIVHADGTKRRLGAYDSATWSPRGLYLAVTRELELLAIGPEGDVRWSLPTQAPITAARWAPNGLRIAYLSGAQLRLVDGNGTDDGLLTRRVAPVAPAWRASAPQELAYVDARGAIRVVEPETRRQRWRSPAVEAPLELAWTEDGSHLLARSERSVRIYAADGALVHTEALPAGTYALDAAWAPDGRRLALLRHRPATRRSDLLLVSVSGRSGPQLFAGGGRFSSAAWSPDGRWIAVAWPDADQWLFLRATGGQGLEAVGEVSRQFASDAGGEFPELVDWCCAPGGGG